MRLAPVIPLLLTLLFQGCATYVSLHKPERIMVLQINPNLDSIRNAILTGASKQGWTILDEADSTIIVTNKPYRHTRYPIIAIDYSLYAIEFNYSSSYNLRYTYITDGKQLVRRDYNKIVNGLAQSIRHQVEEVRKESRL